MRPCTAIVVCRVAARGLRLVLFSGGVACQFAAAQDVALVLRDHATTTTAAVRLVDILEPSSGGPDVPKRMLSAPLWHAPRPCESVRMSRDDVAARLRRVGATPMSGSTTVSGAPQIEIDGGCQRIDGPGVESVARQALGDWLSARSDRFDLVARQVPAALELPPGRVTLSARPFAPGKACSSRMLVWIDAAVAGVFVRSVPVVFDVHAFRGAWLGPADVPAGLDLSAGVLTMQKIDIAAQASDPLRAIPGKARLRKALLLGDALTAAHVEIRPPVSRGTSVVVRSQVGAIDIEARGEALQDGRAGRPVWIRVSTSTGPVLARVVGDGVVELPRD